VGKGREVWEGKGLTMRIDRRYPLTCHLPPSTAGNTKATPATSNIPSNQVAKYDPGLWFRRSWSSVSDASEAEDDPFRAEDGVEELMEVVEAR
jgi:hypothetical protein